MGSDLDSTKNDPEPQAAAAPPERGVIPTSQVVILKERDLDCDVATAIARLRADPETAHSRILVVADDEPEAVAEPPAELPEPRVPTTLQQVARRAQGEALGEAGQRLDLLVACLRRFEEEAAAALDAITTSAYLGDATRLAEPLRQLAEIRGWRDAVLADLDQEARAARDGFQPLDSPDLLREMAGQVEAQYPGVRVQAGAGGGARCWGRAADVAEALFLGLALVALRIGGQGTVVVELDHTDSLVQHRIWGSGEPRALTAPAAVARFKKLVERNGGRVEQDALGAHGTGLTVSLPRVG